MSGAMEKAASIPASGFTNEQRDMIRSSFVPDATEAEFAMLLEVARVRNLNPVTRQIHFVKRYNSQAKREVWAYQVSIDGLRAIAERTGLYGGQDEAEYGQDDDGQKFARVRVYRKDWERPAVGKAYWLEAVQLTREGKPTAMWAKYPKLMLAKCAEALALRKAFPEDLSGLYAEDEMPEAAAPQGEPRRAPEPDVLPPAQERKALAPAPAVAPAEEEPRFQMCSGCHRADDACNCPPTREPVPVETAPQTPAEAQPAALTDAQVLSLSGKYRTNMERARDPHELNAIGVKLEEEARLPETAKVPLRAVFKTQVESLRAAKVAGVPS